MLWRDLSLVNPVDNILFDEVLLQLVERGEGGNILRFWESPVYFVVLGRISSEVDDVNLDTVGKEKVLVVRRASGGGTVVQGPGCLNYSLVINKSDDKKLADIHQSYDYILTKVVRVLAQCGVDAQYFPISDIALKESHKKFSGNAQKRGRNFILHHGTVLYNFDLMRISRYLKLPKNIPEYRNHRNHLEFVSNISISIQEFKSLFAKEFGAQAGSSQLSNLEMQNLNQLVLQRKWVVTV